MTAGTPKLCRPPAPLPAWPRGTGYSLPQRGQGWKLEGMCPFSACPSQAASLQRGHLGTSRGACACGAVRAGTLLSHLAAILHPHPSAPHGRGSAAQTLPLKGHVELCDQEIDVVLLLQLKGLGDDAGGLAVLLPSQPCAVHLQNDVSHLQLPAVVRRAPPLQDREGSAHVPTTPCIKQGEKTGRYFISDVMDVKYFTFWREGMNLASTPLAPGA